MEKKTKDPSTSIRDVISQLLLVLRLLMKEITSGFDSFATSPSAGGQSQNSESLSKFSLDSGGLLDQEVDYWCDQYRVTAEEKRVVKFAVFISRQMGEVRKDEGRMILENCPPLMWIIIDAESMVGFDSFPIPWELVADRLHVRAINRRNKKGW